MSSSRSTRSKKPPAPSKLPPSTPAKTQPGTIKPRPTAKSSETKKQDYFREQYHELYDKGEAFKNHVVEAKGKAQVGKSVLALASTIQAFEALVSDMEAFPMTNWELARPNITPWTLDLFEVSTFRDLDKIRDRIYDLGKRIDALTRLPVLDDPETPEDAEEAAEPGPEALEEENEDEDEEPEFIENETICERCESSNRDCVRRSDQVFGVRCTACASAKRKCSLVDEAKPIKSSPAKTNKSLPIEIPDEDSPPKSKKGKGVLSALTKPFKRKTSDRSPDVPKPSKKPSLPGRSFSPSVSSFNITGTETMAPPLTMTPSFVSIDSFGSDTGRNFEVEHLRLQLTASREDLRLERTRASERERQQAELIDNQRRHYESIIRDLENPNRGEGSSRRK